MTDLSPVPIKIPPDCGDAGQNGVSYQKGDLVYGENALGSKKPLIAQLLDTPANTDCYRGSQGQWD